MIWILTILYISCMKNIFTELMLFKDQSSPFPGGIFVVHFLGEIFVVHFLGEYLLYISFEACSGEEPNNLI